MIGAAIALIVIGLVSTMFLGIFGFVIALAGVALLIAFALGFRRRAGRSAP